MIDAPPGRLVMIVSTAGCIVEELRSYEEAGALITPTNRQVRRGSWRRLHDRKGSARQQERGLAGIQRRDTRRYRGSRTVFSGSSLSLRHTVRAGNNVDRPETRSEVEPASHVSNL